MAHYRPDIDGLRAISVVLVILFHFGIAAVPGGFVGVDVFFVISGYLITNILLVSAPNGSRAILWFYDRRVRRIMPAMLTVIGVCLIAGQIFMTSSDLVALRESALYSITSLANFYFLSNTGYFDNAAEHLPLLHLWSLAVEEQFYIVWPLSLFCLIKIFNGRKSFILMVVGAVALASFIASVKVVASDPKAAFFLPQTRAWELGLGAMLSLIPAATIKNTWMREVFPVLGLVLILFSALTLTANDPFPGLNALAPCLGAALIVFPSSSQTQTASVLGYAPIRLLGKISYSLYLWHWPILVFFRIRFGNSPTVIESVLLIAASIVLAWLTWKYVEMPSRLLKPKQVLRGAIVATFAFVTAAGAAIWIVNSVKSGNWTPERLIVREQFNRARTVNSVDVAFFGDSSCLMGIYPPVLRAALEGKNIESFCMFGSAGAVADAMIIELLAKRGQLPRAAIVVIHPFQFRRLSIVPQWKSFIKTAANAANSDWKIPAIRIKGDFAPQYHRATDLVKELRKSGSLVDPSHGPNTKIKADYSVPKSFENLEAPLTQALTLFNPRDVYLMFPPIPEGLGSGDSDQAAKRVAAILGIPEENFLPTPKYMPVDRFSTFTHLNEIGRGEFSHELARVIEKRILKIRGGEPR